MQVAMHPSLRKFCFHIRVSQKKPFFKYRFCGLTTGAKWSPEATIFFSQNYRPINDTWRTIFSAQEDIQRGIPPKKLQPSS